jgi:transcriptional regulator with GAF, ATPase, and Fis domain
VSEPPPVPAPGCERRLDGQIGARQVGQVPVTGRPFVAGPDVRDSGLADRLWLDTHGVRGFAAVPLEYGGRRIGVLAVFARRPVDPAAVRALAHLAALGALAIGHTLAFREMGRERNRAVAQVARGAPDALRPLADTERDVIARVLVHTRGRVSGPNGAARILGMKATTLFSRMKKLGVTRKPATDAPPGGA